MFPNHPSLTGMVQPMNMQQQFACGIRRRCENRRSRFLQFFDYPVCLSPLELQPGPSVLCLVLCISHCRDTFFVRLGGGRRFGGFRGAAIVLVPLKSGPDIVVEFMVTFEHLCKLLAAACQFFGLCCVHCGLSFQVGHSFSLFFGEGFLHVARDIHRHAWRMCTVIATTCRCLFP